MAPGQGAFKLLPKTPQLQTLVVERERRRSARAGGERQREGQENMVEDNPQREEEMDQEGGGGTVDKMVPLEQAEVSGEEGQCEGEREREVVGDESQGFEEQVEECYDEEVSCEMIEESEEGSDMEDVVEVGEVAPFSQDHPFRVGLRPPHVPTWKGTVRGGSQADFHCSVAVSLICGYRTGP